MKEINLEMDKINKKKPTEEQLIELAKVLGIYKEKIDEYKAYNIMHTTDGSFTRSKRSSEL